MTTGIVAGEPAGTVDATQIQETRKVSEIILREGLYPRIEGNPETVQKYAADLDVLPPIEINQRNELIDGWHRWMAYQKNEIDTIPVKVTVTVQAARYMATGRVTE